MRETFSLIPHSVPKIQHKSRKSSVDEPTTPKIRWKDYLDYFDECYMEYLGRTPPARGYKDAMRYKRAIEKSVEHWGEDTFKAMICWICKHSSEYPQLTLNISIVIGSHGWANMIAQKVQSEYKANTAITSLEEL